MAKERNTSSNFLVSRERSSTRVNAPNVSNSRDSAPSGAVPAKCTERSDSWTKLDIGTKTFQKIHDSSNIEVFLRSRVSSGSFSGASRIEYQLRIDGNASSMSVPHYIFSSNTTEYITLKAVFEDLGPGEHEVEVWAKTNAGTSTDVGVDPAGFGGEIFVTESR